MSVLKPFQKPILVMVSLSVMLTGSLMAPVIPTSYALEGEEYSLTDSISVPGGAKQVNIDASNENVRAVLHTLSDRAGFNLMMDDSVNGNISLELHNVSVNEALKAVTSLANLELVKKNGNIYLVVSKEVAKEKGMDRAFSKVVKVRYSNANRIAAILNQTIFSPPTGQQQQQVNDQKVRADSRTNNLILAGTPAEIQLAEKAIADLDQPRQSKTFFLSNANALDFAAMLSATLFNDGNANLQLGSSGASSSSSSSGNGMIGGVPNSPSQMRVEQEKVQEGSGINTFGGSSGSAAVSGLGQSITLRGTVKETSSISVSPEGPIVIPDTRTNSVTIMGTVEQIALAESLLPVYDAQLPQVSIEASLVEISEIGRRDLGGAWGIGQGHLQFGFNNQARAYNGNDPNTGNSLIGINTVDSANNSFGSAGFSTNPRTDSKQFTMQIRNLLQERKAKMISNATIVAAHDTESVINITDEVIRKVNVTIEGTSGLTTQEIELGEVGVVLDILPKIGEDGTVTMRLRPSVSTVLNQTTDALGNAVTLLKKRDLLTQAARLQDGETLVIGGLVQEGDNDAKYKMPGLGDLPILGALNRASVRNKNRTELVLMVTPHIMSKTNLVPVNFTQPIQMNAVGGGQ